MSTETLSFQIKNKIIEEVLMVEMESVKMKSRMMLTKWSRIGDINQTSHVRGFL